MPYPRVIDLSHHNVIPQSLQPAAEAGVWGVIHKATEGSGFTDSKYKARRALAEDAGLLFGAYHFIRPGDVAGQARFFLDVAVPDDGMLLALDYEDSAVGLDDVLTFLAAVAGEAPGDQLPVLYSGHVLKEKLAGKPDEALKNCRLWLAQYGAAVKLPPGWDKYFLWQFSDQGTVPGIEPPTDLNDYQGTKQSLAYEWTGSDGLAIPQPPRRRERTVRVTIAAPPDVDVIVEQV